MTTIMPCLWIDNRIDEMIEFYTQTFENSKVEKIVRHGEGKPAFTAVIELAGNKFFLLNGAGDHNPFPFTEAVSFMIECNGQAEVDNYWNRFVDNGGEASMCGWCKDRFGLSWQIVPKQMYTTVLGPDEAGAKRAMDAMMQMRKLIVADLEAAYAG